MFLNEEDWSIQWVRTREGKKNHQFIANANRYPARWCFPICYTCCGNSKNPQKVWITNRESAVEPKEWLWHLDKSLSNSYKNKHPGAHGLHCLSCGDAYIKVPNENHTFSTPGRQGGESSKDTTISDEGWISPYGHVPHFPKTSCLQRHLKWPL